MKFQLPSHSLSESPSSSTPSSSRRFIDRYFRIGRAIFLGGGFCLLQACPGPKPTPPAEPVASPTPAATPVATSAPTATPTPEPVARYSGAQQSEYIKTAQVGFIDARSVKLNAFNLAYNAFAAAGGAGATGITSKAAVTARRGLIEQARLANEDYLTFVAGQDDAYRQELAKTPLLPGDTESLVAEFAEKGKKDSLLKMRENKRAILKAADEMMAYLEKKDGDWKLSGEKVTFKKPADANAFSALGKDYNKYVQTEQKLQAEMNAPLPTPSDSLAPSPPPGTAASPVPTVAAPAATPTPMP